MGKFTIKAIFHSFLYVYQRVYHDVSILHGAPTARAPPMAIAGDPAMVEAAKRTISHDAAEEFVDTER